jgi:hypothetical protein
MRVEPAPRSNTLPIQRPPVITASTNTLPLSRAEDIGYGAGLGFTVRPTHRPSTSNSSSSLDEFGVVARPPAGSSSAPGRRPNSSKFTIANMPAETSQPQPQPQPQSQSQVRSGPGRSLWPTAEDEKERLYESARAKVERLQATRQNTPVWSILFLGIPVALIPPVLCSSHP